MAEKYPYTALPGRLREFLTKVPDWGIPNSVSVKWLEQLGYRGGNARTILPVMRFTGIIAQDGKPAAGWDALRRGKAGKADFAALIRKAYADLFATYPDAHRKDAEALRNFFRAQTTAGDAAQAKMVQTFKVLTEFGDFDAPGTTSITQPDAGRRDEAPALTDVRLPDRGAGGLTLHVNIQLQLPASSDGEVYEKLFAAMRDHLLDITGS